MQRLRTRTVVVLALLAGLATYLFLTKGLAALGSSDVVTTAETGHVPEFVYDPPATVPTTATYGPVGPVSVVFAGTEVTTGLTGSVQNPWIAVSAVDGSYRALVAPHLPARKAGAMALAPDGRHLAWGFDGGLVLYDPVHDEATEVTDVGPDPVVGGFSADGRFLLAYDDALRVVDVQEGAVVGTVPGVDREAARTAAWTPDGEAVSHVGREGLVVQRWADDERTTLAASLPPGVTPTWSPDGRRVAAMVERRGVNAVQVYDVTGDRLKDAGTVEYDRYAQQELLGFTGEARVTVTALTMETGTIPLVFNMSTEDAFPPTRVMQLPGRESAVATMEFAAGPLAEGSLAFDEPDWPAGNLAKLTASVILSVFLIGMYLTRLPRERRRRPRLPQVRQREKVDA